MTVLPPAVLVLSVLALAAPGGAATAPADPLAPIRVLEGRWEGVARGEPGKGTSTREYRRDLRGRIVVGRNRSVYEPRKAGAEPEVHEDLGIFSFDQASKRILLRQFHAEGFVNEYALESVDAKSLTFVTIRVENIAPGWRAREVYEIVSPDEIVETFSLAAPGKAFETYSVTRLRRAPSP